MLYVYGCMCAGVTLLGITVGVLATRYQARIDRALVRVRDRDASEPEPPCVDLDADIEAWRNADGTWKFG